MVLPSVFDFLLLQTAGSTGEVVADKTRQTKKRGAAKGKEAAAPADMEVDTTQAASIDLQEALPSVAPHEMVCYASHTANW